MPRRSSASLSASASPGVPMRHSRKLVTLGSGGRPSSRQPRGQPVALVAQRRGVGGGDLRLSQRDRGRPGRERVETAWRPHPLQLLDGGARRHGIAHAQAGQGEGLGQGAHHDERGIALAQRHQRARMELDVGLVDDDDGAAAGERRACLQQRLQVGLGLGRAGGVVGCAQPDDRGAGKCGDHGVHVQGIADLRAEPRHALQARVALVAEHRVHRVRGHRHDRAGPRREERLGDDVEHLVRTAADEDLVGPGADVGGGRFRELGVGRVGILVQRRVPGPFQRSGQVGQHRRAGVGVEAQDVALIEPVASGDDAVGRLPGVDVAAGDERLCRLERHQPWSSKRISTARRWAVRPSASATAATAGRMRARPSRVTRLTCIQRPNDSTPSGL